MQCIDDYLEYFDASIFVLWKLALLQKRIIFCSPPPVGPSCFKGTPSSWFVGVILHFAHFLQCSALV